MSKPAWSGSVPLKIPVSTISDECRVTANGSAQWLMRDGHWLTLDPTPILLHLAERVSVLETLEQEVRAAYRGERGANAMNRGFAERLLRRSKIEVGDA